MGDGCIQHVVLLRPGVHRAGCFPPYHLVGGNQEGGQLGGGKRPVVLLGGDQAVGIEVGRSRDLPPTEPLAVRLPSPYPVHHHQVGLALHRQDWDAGVLAD